MRIANTMVRIIHLTSKVRFGSEDPANKIQFE